MEDQERIEGEDVEAHRRKSQYLAAEDAPPGTEIEGEGEGKGDDVEAHQLRRPPTSG
jgi:hypothetical protein